MLIIMLRSHIISQRDAIAMIHSSCFYGCVNVRQGLVVSNRFETGLIIENRLEIFFLGCRSDRNPTSFDAVDR